MYDWIPSQTDIREPESPLQGARYDISILVSQDRYDYAFLRNDARPATVIVHEQFAERDEREAFRQQFLMEHRGPDNAGKPIFVEASPGDEEINRTFHIEQLGLSQKDAMFIPRMEAKIRAVCVALGTPLSILGDASGRTFNNAGQEYRNWWEGTLLPLMDDLSDAVNMRLAPRLGPEVGWFDTSHVAALKAENKIYALGAAAATFIENKIFTINEVREAYNLKPFTDAELAEIEKPKEMMRQETKTTEPNDDESRDTDRRSALPDLPVTILSETDNILVLQKGA
jgi:phage portal protein BeeE